MTEMGMEIAHRHLNAFDRLIGVVGEAGSGKSILLRGMFPGLLLSNDDNGVNVRPLPILEMDAGGFYAPHTYHFDMRFELAFTQPHVLAEATKQAIQRGKRVVVEHFELLYPFLDMNAELIIGIGENIIVTRPTLFGPEPEDVAQIAHRTIRFRRMAHTAEHLAEWYLREHGCECTYAHSDVRRGFVLEFTHCPEVDLQAMERWMQDKITQDLPISYVDDHHVQFGEHVLPCTGPRMHVSSSAEVETVRLVKPFYQDPIDGNFLLVGFIGEETQNLRDLNKISFENA